jgi:hypothetical protein
MTTNDKISTRKFMVTQSSVEYTIVELDVEDLADLSRYDVDDLVLECASEQRWQQDFIHSEVEEMGIKDED